MKILAIVILAFVSHATLAQSFVSPCADADIVFLADWSGSIGGYESNLTEGLSTLVGIIPPKENAIRYGVVSFSGSAWVNTQLTSDSSKIADVISLWKYQDADGGTNLFAGLLLSNSVFETSPRVTTKVLVIVTDGDVDNDTEKTAISFAKKMQGNGIIILTVDVGNASTDPKVLEEISDHYFLTDMLNLSKTLSSIFTCM